MTEETKQHPCPTCKGMRNCRKICSYTDLTHLGLMCSSVEYDILQCQGCETIFFHIQRNLLPYLEDRNISEYYPNIPLAGDKFFPEAFARKLPSDISTLYAEIVCAINGELPQLAVAGVRTIIDRICQFLTNASGGFAKNLETLYEFKYISRPQFEQLKIIVDIGNSVVHRKHAPSVRDVLFCFDVVNAIVETIFFNTDYAKKMEATIPKKINKV